MVTLAESSCEFHLGSATVLPVWKPLLAAAALLPVWSVLAHAQHEGHGHAPPPEAEPSGHLGSGPTVAQLELRRNASGTAWQPEKTPHAALHTTAAGLDLMFHALLFGGYDYQGSDRGDHGPVAVGWLMGMAQKRFETGSVTARIMLSPEPWTATHDGGYPLLLQTGETFEGKPLHDRQHPHDLFMELGAVYTQGVMPGFALQLYGAVAGEPALGPVAYPHRYSASSDPFATLAHHWQDSTHITFGVLTAGVLTRWGKLEGSWFNGREPDETRYDFDLRKLDSYAARLSLAPGPAWSGQVSYGYLASPETLRPENSTHRVTASVMHVDSLGEHGHWASTVVFGLNKEGHHSPTSAVILETNADLDGNNIVFGRAEFVQKTGHDLVLTPELEESRFSIVSLAAGYLRNLDPIGGFVFGLGARGAIGSIPAEVKPFYGTRTALGGIVFARISVAPMTLHGMDH